MTDAEQDQGSFHIPEDALRPVGPGVDAGSSFDPGVLDFGHYAGRTIAELANDDPDYLQWLERHPSGVRYRAEIHRVLGIVPRSTEWNR